MCVYVHSRSGVCTISAHCACTICASPPCMQAHMHMQLCATAAAVYACVYAYLQLGLDVSQQAVRAIHCSSPPATLQYFLRYAPPPRPRAHTHTHTRQDAYTLHIHVHTAPLYVQGLVELPAGSCGAVEYAVEHCAHLCVHAGPYTLHTTQHTSGQTQWGVEGGLGIWGKVQRCQGGMKAVVL